MSQFGHLFRITTFGESHCPSVGVIIEGVASNMVLDTQSIQKQLDRRRPGQSTISTDRNEKDQLEVLSGLEDGKTLGTPLCIRVNNRDMRPQDYIFNPQIYIPRPSHADYTYLSKYNIHAKSGGGRSSARETIGRVIGGSVAELILNKNYGIEVVAWVKQVGHLQYSLPKKDYHTITRDIVDRSIVRCPHLETSNKMIQYIKQLKEEGDSIGGIVSCVIRGVPTGIGEPVFDKLEAQLAKAMMSIPATKGFEIGSGFDCVKMLGSQHNDMFIKDKDKGKGCLRTMKNDSGGVIGGISSGEDIYFSVAFKPPATINKPQQTCDIQGNNNILETKGRHDPCVVNRAVPIVEAMANLVIIDSLLVSKRLHHPTAPNT